MTELKQTEINFEEKTTDSPVFKLKVTNIRKSAYSTNTPEESDFFNFKIGDYLSKGGSAIYQVCGIHREPISQHQIDKIDQKLKNYASPTHDLAKLKQLFEEYKKNGNFGVCRITVKCVLRSGKEVSGRIYKFLEFEQSRYFTYNCFQKVDLQNVIKHKNYTINKLKATISNQQQRLISQENTRDAILKIIARDQQTQIQEDTSMVQAVIRTEEQAA
jgi:hypothetical protein